MSTFGNRLRVAIERQMTLTEFSEKTGFDLPFLSHLIHNHRRPSFDTLVRLLEALPQPNARKLILGDDRDSR
ncbi:helix-turn-helix domain-containing protein [Paraburkholderia sp. BCC1885]|uniref:helix-turn-helix domain-containing protein n=1 Tax=Paraburkholderia sp. BCC1885 TaxID=2562669 RepID=UPI001642C8CA|nr:helix-turn-helix transcriptional regulator [Paraburkholderia sp. BCC1885]